MDIYDYNDLVIVKDTIIHRINKGQVFIHPTDTIYGIGCDATNIASIRRVRNIKKSKNPFSIIVPSLNWVKEHCIINTRVKEWLNRLPGPYTLILELKDKNSVPYDLNLGTGLIGIRIPNHWISSLVSELGYPIITTSANRSAQPYMTSLDDLDDKLKAEIDFVIYEGKKEGNPSKIIHLHKEFKIIER